jgi:GT2 family glycosyltransferase
MPKTLINEIGAFDERFFMYCEDVDLCMRIKKSGKDLYYYSDPTIVHHTGAASKKVGSYFGVLMLNDSVDKLFLKNYGYWAKALYRLVVLTGALFRLSLLSLTIINVIFNKKRRNDFKYSFFKYISLIQWCFNLKKAVVVK